MCCMTRPRKPCARGNVVAVGLLTFGCGCSSPQRRCRSRRRTGSRGRWACSASCRNPGAICPPCEWRTPETSGPADTQTHTHTRACALTHTQRQTQRQTRTHARTHIHIHTRTYASTHAHTHTCIHTHTHTHTHTHARTHARTHTHTHTHTHTTVRHTHLNGNVTLSAKRHVPMFHL